MKIKKTLDFIPENVETIEKIAAIQSSYDYHSKVEAAPEFREKFRYLAKIRGSYIPSRQAVSMNLGRSIVPSESLYAQSPSGSNLDMNNDSNGIPDWAMPNKKSVSGFNQEYQFPGMPPLQQVGGPQYQPASKVSGKINQFTMAMLRGAIHPDSVFDTENKPRNLVVQNVTEGPVVIAIGKVSVGRGNVEDFENKNYIKIDSFKSLDQIPNEFFSSIQFRNSFYSQPPSLIFISDKQYRERVRYVEAKKEHERLMFEELRNRIEDGAAGGVVRKEGNDASSMMSRASGSQTMYDNMPEYDDGTVVHMDVTEDITRGNQGGLTQHMQSIAESDGTMSEDEIGSYLRSMNL